ncbi:MAG TPA: glycerophosphodiester phosphodiesterase family protein [bacterium]|nr:glycerophosphodiester phosphodiesterase family protein [bacterium]
MKPRPQGHLPYRGRRVLLKYHRLLNGRHTHPPNSVAALRCVLAGGAEVVEFDVRLTRDEKFVLIHDTDLASETSGRGSLRGVTEAQFKTLRLRGSDEPAATLADVAEILRLVDRPVKVQIDLKEAAPITPEIAAALLRTIAPIRNQSPASVVVGSMGDWNLRLLRRLDPELAVGLDFGSYLDVPMDGAAGIPRRINAYGYVDDHPLGRHRLMPIGTYLENRLDVLLNLVPGAREVYVRKELLLQALADGVNPIAFIHDRSPGALVDVWTLHADEPEIDRLLLTALESGADQITSPDPARLVEVFAAMSCGSH